VINICVLPGYPVPIRIYNTIYLEPLGPRFIDV
jgi:hypothetical protein